MWRAGLLLPGRLTAAQHHHYGQIISSLHVHLDHDHCLEVLVVRGRARALRDLAERLIATRGVKHGRLHDDDDRQGSPVGS